MLEVAGGACFWEFFLDRGTFVFSGGSVDYCGMTATAAAAAGDFIYLGAYSSCAVLLKSC